MPAVAAHYQLGQLVISDLSQKLKNIINSNKRMYDLGLQGPDILFFYRPFKDNETKKKGEDIHHNSAVGFFKTALSGDAALNEKALAYLIGACCHYALDRSCHPYVMNQSHTDFDHQRIESDFDCAIIRQYSMSFKRHKYVPTREVCFESIADIYKCISAEDIKEAVCSMHCTIRLFEHRKIVQLAERLAGRVNSLSSLCINKRSQNALCIHKMMLFFKQAQKDAIKLIDEIFSAYQNKSSNIKGFDENFEGSIRANNF